MLTKASQEFSIPVSDWLDLSTGISPWTWPVPQVPEHVWRCLPDEADKSLELAAAGYYGCDSRELLGVPGSQFAIEHLPLLLESVSVAIPHLGYQEHLYHWKKAGHRIFLYKNKAQLQSLINDGYVRYAVVINPNNPGTETIGVAELANLGHQLADLKGWLLVDEAFMDPAPENSMLGLTERPGVVVLRSVGKFFGLAGLRLGFTVAAPSVLAQLSRHLSTWQLSHPARWLGAQAFADVAWQAEQRVRLKRESIQWLAYLADTVPALEWRCTELFVTGLGDSDYCETLYRRLAGKGILIRHFDATTSESKHGVLRLGLPTVQQYQRFAQTLDFIMEEVNIA